MRHGEITLTGPVPSNRERTPDQVLYQVFEAYTKSLWPYQGHQPLHLQDSSRLQPLQSVLSWQVSGQLLAFLHRMDVLRGAASRSRDFSTPVSNLESFVHHLVNLKMSLTEDTSWDDWQVGILWSLIPQTVATVPLVVLFPQFRCPDQLAWLWRLTSTRTTQGCIRFAKLSHCDP